MALALQQLTVKEFVNKSDIDLLSTKEELEKRIKESEWNMISKQMDFYKVISFIQFKNSLNESYC